MRDHVTIQQEIREVRDDLRDKIAMLRAKFDVRTRTKNAFARREPLVLGLVVGAVLLVALYVGRRIISRRS